METTNKKNSNGQEAAATNEHQAGEQKAVAKAHEQAEEDMGTDPDFSIHSPNDDLDEGEISRLGEDVGGII